MKDGIKIFIAVLLLVAIVFLCIKYGKTPEIEPVNEIINEQVENVVENKEVENTTVEPEDNENTAKNEVVEDDEGDVETTVLKQNTGSQIYENSDSKVGSTSEKQKAVNLVKAQWGEDNTVSFQCDHVTSDGEYVVAVSSLSSAKVLNYFRVNVEDGTVEVEY